MASLFCSPALAVDDSDYVVPFGYAVDYTDGTMSYFAADAYALSGDSIPVDQGFSLRGVSGVLNCRCSGAGITSSLSTSDLSSFFLGNALSPTYLCIDGNAYGTSSSRLSYSYYADNAVVVYDYVLNGVAGDIDTLYFSGLVKYYLVCGLYSGTFSGIGDGVNFKAYIHTPRQVDLLATLSDGSTRTLSTWTFKQAVISGSQSNVSDVLSVLDFGDGVTIDVGDTVVDVYFRLTYRDLPTTFKSYDGGVTSNTYRGYARIAACYDMSSFLGSYAPSVPFEDKVLDLLQRIYTTLSPEMTGILYQILQAIKDSSAGMAVSPDDKQAAEDFRQEVGEKADVIDSMAQEIEEKQNRPAVADIVPVVDTTVINPTDPAAVDGMQVVSGILSTPLLLQMLMVVFSLAFLRYVIFGKSEG